MNRLQWWIAKTFLAKDIEIDWDKLLLWGIILCMIIGFVVIEIINQQTGGTIKWLSSLK